MVKQQKCAESPRNRKAYQNKAEPGCIWTECKDFSLTECQLEQIKMQNGSHTHPHPSRDPNSWHFDYYTKNNSRKKASGNNLSCLSFLLRPLPNTSPGPSHKLAIWHCWCREHTISCNTIPCFLVPSILHIPGLASTSSDLWRQCFTFRKKHRR